MMAERGYIDFVPGGLNTDVAENLLGQTEFQDVKNMRMDKAGEWVNDTAWIALKTGLSGVKSGIEITDDLSGDRFILYHSGTNIYRIDYDSGDGNGYENETPAALSLPSGVSVSASDDLRYFFNNGVVRITGASAVLRYEYVSRTILGDAIELIDKDDFESTVEGWVGSGATLSLSSSPVKWGTYALRATQTALNGVAKKTFTLVSGDSYIFRAWLANSSGSGNRTIHLGSTDGGTEYGTASYAAMSGWARVEISFTATGTSLYAEFNPGEGDSATYCNMDLVKLERVASSALASWSLTKAEIESADIDYGMVIHVLNGSTYKSINIKCFLVYDNGQYSLLGDSDAYNTLARTIKTNANYITLLLKIPSSLFNNKRITGIAAVAAVSTLNNDATTQVKYITEMIDFVNGLDDVIWLHGNLYWANGTPDQLYVRGTGTNVWYLNNGLIMPGNRIKLENEYGSAEGEILEIDESDDSDASNPNEHFLYFKIDGPISSLLDGSGTSQLLPLTKITIYRRIFNGYLYDVDGSAIQFLNTDYLVWTALDLTSGTDYYDFTGLPAGVSKIFYDYSHFALMENKAFVLSKESGEGDLIRYSPTYQPDVFPSTFYAQTEVGDRDDNKALIERDGRISVIKKKSISQMSLYGSTIREDVGIAQRGLYADYLYIVIDNLLYFGDEDDVYLFNGVQAVPFLLKERVRKLYQAHVDSGSFMAYNKKRNELWLVLDTIIMVYQFDYGVWTSLEYASMPIQSFLMYDNALVGVLDTGFINFNHSSSTFGEEITAYFKARVVDLQSPEAFKKAFKQVLVSKSSVDVTVTLTDSISGSAKSQSYTPDATKITALVKWPFYLFREFYVEITTAASTSLDFIFKSLKIGIEKWR